MRQLDFLENTYISIYDYFDSNTYIIISKEEALLVDPHINADIEKLLQNNKIRKITIILTHEHCDHISGIWWYLKNFECKIICSKKCAERISNKKYTRPLMISFKLQEDDLENNTHKLEKFKKDYVWTAYNADITFETKMHYTWCSYTFDFQVIEGHSKGSSYIVLDNKYVFTGDSLIKDYPIIVSFPQGNKKIFQDVTIPLLESELKSDMVILPGHGEPFILEEIMNDGRINVETR